MSHNYYEDYRIQFNNDYAKGVQPALSELAQQGLAYCTAVLTLSSGASRAVRMDKTQVAVPGAMAEAALYAAKYRIMQRKYTEAIALSNHIVTVDAADILDNMRPGYQDLWFGNEAQEEIYRGAAEHDANGADAAVLCMFPAVKDNAAIVSAVTTLNRHASIEIWRALTDAGRQALDDANKEPITLINGRNPYFAAIHGINLADFISTHRNTFLGRVVSGQKYKQTTFTPETSFIVSSTASQLNKLPTLRRLSRGATCYVAAFDTYLTYLTDLCRMIETTLDRRDVTRTADVFLSNSRSIY